jgi:phage shock protein A
MGVFKRIGDITKASVNEMLDKMENPVLMLNQYLRDMEEEIHKAEATIAKQMADAHKYKQRYDESVRNSAERETQAERAMMEGQEELARKLLEEKLYFDQKTTEFLELHTQSEGHVEELKQQLQSMKNEFEQLRNKRDELASRAKIAEARKQMSSINSVHTIESGSASHGFHRMEEKILQMEAEAEVMRIPNGTGFTLYQPIADAEKQLKVDEQLAALKEKLNK